MVKFQEYFVKKRHKFGKGHYKYRGVLIRVPKKFHHKIDAFIRVDLTVQSVAISEFNEKHIITITLCASRAPQKSGPELLNQLANKMRNSPEKPLTTFAQTFGTT
jgi:hypothetical protein